MSAEPVALHPPVSWAQRNDLLYVIIEVECKDIDYKFTDSSMKFTGTDVLDSKKVYDLQLNFLKTIDPERVSSKNIARCLEFTIYKKQSGPYWSSLTNDKTKLHFLKANFNKWKDESDDEEPEQDTIEAPWNKFMDDSSELKNFDDFEDDDDSDDNIPSLSQNDEDDEADEKTKADKTQKSALNEKI